MCVCVLAVPKSCCFLLDLTCTAGLSHTENSGSHGVVRHECTCVHDMLHWVYCTFLVVRMYVQKFDGVGVGALVHFAVMGRVLPSSRSLPAGSPDLHHLLSPRDHSVHWHQQSAWGRKPWQ